MSMPPNQAHLELGSIMSISDQHVFPTFYGARPSPDSVLRESQPLQFSSPAYNSIGTTASEYTVIGYTPTQGISGTNLAICLRSSRTAPSPGSFQLIVEGRWIPCSVSQSAADGHFRYFAVDTIMPPSDLSIYRKSMNLSLRISDENDIVISDVRVGGFTSYAHTIDSIAVVLSEQSQRRRPFAQRDRSKWSPNLNQMLQEDYQDRPSSRFLIEEFTHEPRQRCHVSGPSHSNRRLIR